MILPDDGRIAAKAVLPHLIADHRHRVRIPSGVFCRLESAPENRTHADRIKIVRVDDAAVRALGPVADAERGPRDLLRNEGIDQRAASLKIKKVWPRHVI